MLQKSPVPHRDLDVEIMLLPLRIYFANRWFFSFSVILNDLGVPELASVEIMLVKAKRELLVKFQPGVHTNGKIQIHL